MFKQTLFAAVIVFVSFASQAFAQSPRPVPISGYDLLEACRAVEAVEAQDVDVVQHVSNLILAAQCWSQIDGFFSGVRLQNLRTREAGLARPVGAACVPDTLDLPDLREALLSYIQRNPAARTQRAGVVLSLAFENAYPCR